jgi:predicted ATPase
MAGEEAERLCPVVASLLGIEMGAGWESPAPEAVAPLLADALRCLLQNSAPAVLFIEDLHWADGASLELLTTITDLTDVAPVLVLVTMRLDADSPAWDYAFEVARRYRHRHQEIRLDPLEAPDAERLIRNLLDLAELPRGLRAEVLDRCGGNPLFLEEVLRGLIQRGAIVRDEDRWIIHAAAQGETIPTTVRGVIDARIDALPEGVRTCLQHAAVLGRTFTRTALCALMEAPDDLDAQLGHLQRVDLVRQRSGASGPEFEFKAALTRESAYAGISSELLVRLHGRAATELEHADASAEQAALLAHHYERAGDAARAIHHALRAAERASRLHAREQAVLQYWRVLDLLGQLPRTEERRSQHLEVVLGLLSLPGWARNEDARVRALDELDVAVETAQQRDDQALLARLESTRGLRLQDEAAFKRALEHAKASHDTVVEAVAQRSYGDYLGSLGNYEQAFQYIDRAIDLYQQAGEKHGHGMSMVGPGRCYCARAGRLEDALAYAKRAREVADADQNRTLHAWRAMEAEPYMYLGDWEGVLRVVGEGLPVAIEVDARWPLLFGAAWASIANRKLGRLDEAQSQLELAERDAEAHAGTTFPSIVIALARAELELERGQQDRARKAVDHALGLARQGSYRLEEGAALRVRARVLAASRDREAAKASFEESLTMLQTIESRPELAQTLLAFGQFLSDDDEHRSGELVVRAVELFEAMGAQGWLEEAQAFVASA